MKRTEFLMFVMFALLLFSCDQADNGVLEKGTIETVSYTHLDVYKRQDLS